MSINEMVTFGIVDGPSRDAIFDAMKYNYETRLPLDFKIIKGSTIPEDGQPESNDAINTRDVEIHTIQHEDGSGFNFNLEGYIDIKIEGQGYIPRRFKAFYNAKSRKGSISLKRF